MLLGEAMETQLLPTFLWFLRKSFAPAQLQAAPASAGIAWARFLYNRHEHGWQWKQIASTLIGVHAADSMCLPG
jgi:hypothetical protein